MKNTKIGVFLIKLIIKTIIIIHKSISKKSLKISIFFLDFPDIHNSNIYNIYYSNIYNISVKRLFKFLAYVYHLIHVVSLMSFHKNLLILFTYLLYQICNQYMYKFYFI